MNHPSLTGVTFKRTQHLTLQLQRTLPKQHSTKKHPNPVQIQYFLSSSGSMHQAIHKFYYFKAIELFISFSLITKNIT